MGTRWICQQVGELHLSIIFLLVLASGIEKEHQVNNYIQIIYGFAKNEVHNMSRDSKTPYIC